MFRRRQKPGSHPPAPGDVYQNLRGLALGATEDTLGPPGAHHPGVSGVVVDIPAQGGFATLVSLSDGTTSMYTSVGGGTIGAGKHEKVAAATHTLLAAANAQLEMFNRAADDSLPATGAVRFHVLCPSGGRTQDVGEDAFWGRAEHQLLPVIAAAQHVLTTMREAAPG